MAGISLFSASPDLLSCLQLRADKQYKAKNGPLDCVQKNYHVAESTPDSKPAMVAEDYTNRLRKNLKNSRSGLARKGLNVTACMTPICQNNVAVDRYADWVVVQEYAPPKLLMLTKRVSVCSILSLQPFRYWGLRQTNWC